MAYRTLAQKYRPQTFEDVIGQATVTRTLKNSILGGRIANAYIFCGPRGVGKTSIARLLSKTLNCEDAVDAVPCNVCASCREITQGNNIDVLEIDGASNRGIDEIRTLRENVKFSPSKGKFKIYIIDEVHMLTPEAFNALLKTLEEPPLHVKFLFATTEQHKVIATIMSRCQRFDFKRIPPKQMFDRLMDIAGKEGIKIDEKAALLISRSADGSLRDALVILDQMVSFSGDNIKSDDVIELLGMVDKQRIFDLSDAIIENDSKASVLFLDDIINSGKDPVFITESLINHFRDLMILKAAGEPTSDMAFSEDELLVLNEQISRLSSVEIMYMLQNIINCLGLMKTSSFTRAPLEIALIRLSKRASVLSIPGILSKLKEMGSGYEHKEITSNPKVRDEKRVVKEVSSEKQPESVLHAKESVSNAGVSASADTDLDSDSLDESEPGSGDFSTVNSHWKSLLCYMKQKKISLYTFLSVAKPVEFNEKEVVIGFSNDHTFNKEVLETTDNKALVEEGINKVLGASPRLQFSIMDFLGESETTEAKEVRREKDKADKEEMKPFIETAMDVFGGNVVRDYKEEAG